MTDAQDQIRLSDRDRQAAAERLHAAAAEGRLTLTEVDERLAAVYAARFPGDLEPLFRDLPGTGRELAPRTPVAPMIQNAPLIAGGQDVLSPNDFPDQPLVLSTGMGTIRRGENWRVPGWLRVEIGAGTIVLNCVGAHFDQQVTAIDLDVGMGTFRVLVGEGVTANIDRVMTGSGSARSKVSSLPTRDFPHLIFAGRVGTGSLVVRRPYFSRSSRSAKYQS